MIITWYGQACFKIVVQKGKDGSVNILTDPFDKETGLRSPRIEADILLFTHNDKKAISKPARQPARASRRLAGGESFLITGPGEYDIKGLYIQGIPASAKNNKTSQGTTIYTIEAEGMKICHLGSLDQGELASKELEAIGDVDILMVPIGGKEALDTKEAIKIMSQIEPKIVIPMYYKIPGLKIALDGLDKFLKSLGIKKIESLPKLSIKKKDLPEEEAKIITLKP